MRGPAFPGDSEQKTTQYHNIHFLVSYSLQSNALHTEHRNYFFLHFFINRL